MKKIMIAGIAALALSISAFAEDEIAIKVNGMTCGGCAKKVTKALSGMDGVKVGEVSSKKGLAMVTIEKGKSSKADVMAAQETSQNFNDFYKHIRSDGKSAFQVNLLEVRDVRTTK